MLFVVRLLCFSDAKVFNQKHEIWCFLQKARCEATQQSRIGFPVFFLSRLCFSGSMFDEFVLYVCASLVLFLVREFGSLCVFGAL